MTRKIAFSGEFILKSYKPVAREKRKRMILTSPNFMALPINGMQTLEQAKHAVKDAKDACF